MRISLIAILVPLSMLVGCNSSITVTSLTPPDSTSPAPQGGVTLNWNAPTANTDQTSLTDLASYRVHYGTSSGSYTQAVNVGLGTTAAIQNLTSGTTYYFVVSAVNTSGAESDVSNEIAKIAQ